MSIRTILAAASGGTASGGAIGLACQLACRFQAHLEALHVVPDRAALYAAAGPGIGSPGSAAIIETMMQEAAAKAERARAAFDEAAGRYGLARHNQPQLAAGRPSASWREETGGAADLVAQRGRFFDLIVLGRSDRVVAEPHSDTIEETLVHSGRPVLLAPCEPPSRIGDSVAVAWNGSPEAVRALAAALPFLEKADAVSLITLGDVNPDGAGARDYLGWHGIRAQERTVAATSRRHAGQALLDAARDNGADLLVMGAYGQAPWREQLFGGATRSAVAAMALPLLLAH